MKMWIWGPLKTINKFKPISRVQKTLGLALKWVKKVSLVKASPYTLKH
jgi:hypothetical protein